jgi:hypothetical protein
MTEYEKQRETCRAKLEEMRQNHHAQPAGQEHPARRSKKTERELTRPHDAEVFRAAAAMLNMTATHDAPKFGVTRQTFSKWMRGKTSAPRAVYVELLEMVINAAGNGTANIAAAVKSRIGERLSAANGIMTRDKTRDDNKTASKVAPRQIAQKRNEGAFSEWLSDLKQKGG